MIAVALAERPGSWDRTTRGSLSIHGCQSQWGKMGQWAPGRGRSTVLPDGFSGTVGGIAPTVQSKSSSTAKLCGLINVLFFWPCCMAYRILVPWLGIEPEPPAVEASLVTQLKNALANAGDMGSIPGSERSPGEGLAWNYTVHGVAKNQTGLSYFPFPFQILWLWDF